jgi:hypothetical protein
LYIICKKHAHPLLHRTFFLYAALIITTGLTAWMCALVVYAARLVGAPLPTILVILIIGLLLGAWVFLLEWVYNHLRQYTDGVPPRRALILLVWAAVYAVVCMIALCIALVYIWQGLVDVWERQAVDHMPQLRALLDKTPQVNNTRLQGRYDTGARVAREASSITPEEITFSDMLLDTAGIKLCESRMTPMYNAIIHASNINEARDFARYLANRTSTPTSIDVQRYDESVACWPQELNIFLGVRLLSEKQLTDCAWQISDENKRPTSSQLDPSSQDDLDYADFQLWDRWS